MKVQRDGRDFKVVAWPDGDGLVSHSGSAMLVQIAEKTGLRRALSQELEERSSGIPGTTWAVSSVTSR